MKNIIRNIGVKKILGILLLIFLLTIIFGPLIYLTSFTVVLAIFITASVIVSCVHLTVYLLTMKRCINCGLELVVTTPPNKFEGF